MSDIGIMAKCLISAALKLTPKFKFLYQYIIGWQAIVFGIKIKQETEGQQPVILLQSNPSSLATVTKKQEFGN